MPSSVVSAISYDLQTQVLRVIFVSGMIYDYKQVPELVYKEMKTPGSKGQYLNNHIKGKFEFEKVNR